MREIFEAIDQHHVELSQSKDITRWWPEIVSSYQSDPDIAQLTDCQLAAMMSYAGNIGNIPEAEYAQFQTAIYATREALKRLYGSSNADAKLYNAARHSPYI